MSNLEKWLEEIKLGRRGWIRVYKSAFGTAISDPSRFFSALKIYGDTILFDAIIISSTKTLKDDPLNYILAVAHSKAQEEVDRQRGIDEYILSQERAKANTEARNKDLAQRIERAKQLTMEVKVERDTI